MKILLLISLIVGITACDQKSSDGTKERATAEQEAGTDVQNSNLAKKAQKMELDLANRHYFYNAIEGEYQGSMQINNESYKIKFTFVRSLPPFTGNRIRELSEIENDLNGLYFNMQVVQWHPADDSTAVGCRVSGLKPNMDEGQLVISSVDCPNLYNVNISEGGSNAFKNKDSKAKYLAQKIQSKQTSKVNYLIGTVQPSSNAAKYYFTVKKVN